MFEEFVKTVGGWLLFLRFFLQVLITIENMNVHSLDLMDQIRAYHHHHRHCDSDDVLEMASFGKTLSAVELYSCSTKVASPVLHDTELSVCLERRAHYQPIVTTSGNGGGKKPAFFSETDSSGFRSLPVDVEAHNASNSLHLSQNYSIRGRVVNPLKVSLHRNQFGQILDTLQSLTQAEDANYKNPFASTSAFHGRLKQGSKFSKIGPAPAAAPSSSSSPHHQSENSGANIPIDGSFSVPRIILQLCPDDGFSENKRALVSFSLEDFIVGYSKPKTTESTTEITLGSFVAEDLSIDESSPHRTLASSIASRGRAEDKVKLQSGLSTSCPHLNTATG